MPPSIPTETRTITSETFANSVLGCGIVYCLTVLWCITFLPLPSLQTPIVDYVVLTISLFAFAFACTWSAKRKVHFALIVLGTGVTVYGIEIALFYRRPAFPRYLFQRDGHVDTRTAAQVVHNLRQQGRNVFPALGAGWRLWKHLNSDDQTLFSLAGLSNTPTVLCNEAGQWVMYDSDEYGFRNPKGVYAHAALDIIVLGDSYGHGWCVGSGEDIAGQLRRQDRTVVNLAYTGNGPLIELASLTEYGAAFSPKVVLWLYYEKNDLDNLQREAHSPLLQRYLERDFRQGLRERQSEIDRQLISYHPEEGTDIWYFGLVRVMRLHQLRSRLSLLLPRSPPPPFQTRYPLFRHIMQEVRDRVAAWNGQLYFIYLPSWDRYRGIKQEFSRDDVLAVIADLEIPLIDFHEILSTHPDPFSLFPHRDVVASHYTAEGYRLLAQQIDRYLAEE